VPSFQPEELLQFVELRPFTRAWSQLALTDDDLLALQIAIMRHPRAGAVVAGTGGLRKLRFVPPGWSTGKSGALRVCYAHFESHGIVLLAIVYPKSKKDDLTVQEKQRIRELIQRCEADLSR
jgi:hypothetical protein